MPAPLDVRRLVADRRPGYSLDARFYAAGEIYDLDLDLIFGRHWLFVAVEAELPEPGDYITRDIGNHSIVIVRDEDGELRAHANVCRHRGAKLVTEPSGSVGKLVCPYHQWTYELTGELIYASNMGEGFDRSCLGLKPVHLRSIEGLLFICLGETPPADIDDMARAMAPRLAPHDLRNTKVAWQSDLIEEGNWKLVMENNRECYHCLSNHPELTVSLFQFGFGFEPDEDNPTEMEDARAFVAEQERLTADWEARGFPSHVVEALVGRATGFRTQRLILAGSGEAMTADTRVACRRLLGSLTDAKLGALHYWTQPNSWHHFQSDHAITFAVFPLDAGRSLLKTTWLVHKDAVEGVDYDVENLIRVWEATNAQDAALVARAQSGARSPAYEPGPYSPLTEPLVDQFATWYLERLSAHLGEAAR